MKTLPPELLQRVASFSSFESVLALIKVNRQFHRICYDKIVFTRVIENANGLGGEQWNCGFLAELTSVSDLACFALADLKARTWLETLEMGEPVAVSDRRAEPRESDEKESEQVQVARHLPDESLGHILSWAP